MPRISPAPITDEACVALHAELLSLPARHLHELPVLTRIVVHHPGISRDITLVTGPIESPAGSLGALVLDGEELTALARGVEAERVWPCDFTGFCLLKQHDPRFRLDDHAALAGAQWIPGERAWSLGRVLKWLGLTLVSVELIESGDRVAAPVTAGVRAA